MGRMEAERRNGHREVQRYNFGKSGSVGKTPASEIWKASIDFCHCGYKKKRYTECLCVHVGNGSEGVEMSSGRIEQTVEVGSAEARRERILKTGMMLKSRRSRKAPLKELLVNSE